jgi:hypothetical protein
MLAMVVSTLWSQQTEPSAADKVRASTAKMRESLARQAASLRLQQASEGNDFFILPPAIPVKTEVQPGEVQAASEFELEVPASEDLSEAVEDRDKKLTPEPSERQNPNAWSALSAVGIPGLLNPAILDLVKNFASSAFENQVSSTSGTGLEIPLPMILPVHPDLPKPSKAPALAKRSER